jgi:hypothetical protein
MANITITIDETALGAIQHQLNLAEEAAREAYIKATMPTTRPRPRSRLRVIQDRDIDLRIASDLARILREATQAAHLNQSQENA